jgi:hypothetical protein
LTDPRLIQPAGQGDVVPKAASVDVGLEQGAQFAIAGPLADRVLALRQGEQAFDLPLANDASVWLARFALAWTAGLVVPGAPGGLGVFEAVLLLRMGVALPEAPLLAVALSYRLIVTLTDLLGAALVSLDGSLARGASSGTPTSASTPTSDSPSQ